jgi:uncharacterized membrane protein YoaK (UPF0700 family)
MDGNFIATVDGLFKGPIAEEAKLRKKIWPKCLIIKSIILEMLIKRRSYKFKIATHAQTTSCLLTLILVSCSSIK